MQVGARRRQPAAVVHVAVERGESLLAIAVDVVGERVARLLDRREEGLEQRSARGAALEHERTRVAAEGVVRGRGEAVLHALEVGQAVRVVPALHPRARGPALVVERVAALEDHAVDAARPAEQLAARVIHAPAAHVGLGLGLVAPVVEAVPDRERQRSRHVDEDVPRPVRSAGLEHQHLVGRVLRQPVGERAARRAAADDDEVVRQDQALASSCFGVSFLGSMNGFSTTVAETLPSGRSTSSSVPSPECSIGTIA